MCQKCREAEGMDERDPQNVQLLSMELGITPEELLVIMEHKKTVQAEIAANGGDLPQDLKLASLLKACVGNQITDRQLLSLSVAVISATMEAKQRAMQENPIAALLASLAGQGPIPIPGGQMQVMRFPGGGGPLLPKLDELDPHKHASADPTQDTSPLKQALFQALQGAGKPKGHKGH